MGPELLTNTSFDASLTGWHPSGGMTWNSGSAEFNSNSFMYQVPTVIVGETYRLTFDYFTHKDDPVSSPGSIDYSFGAQNTHLSSPNASPLRISHDYVATQADIDSGVIVYFSQGSNFINIDNVSLRRWSLPVYSTALISAVSRVVQGLAAPSFIMGGRQTASYALFKKTSTMGLSLIRFEPIKPSAPFIVKEILIPLTGPVDTNVEIIPVLYFDSEDSLSIGTPINPTNYADGQNFIKLTADSFPDGSIGQVDAFLELQFTGSALLPVSLPITMYVETIE